MLDMNLLMLLFNKSISHHKVNAIVIPGIHET